jgi:hypothetical protein
VASPAVPAASTATGGALLSGVYYYALSAVDAAGNQTVLSTPAIVTIIADNSTVNVTGRAPFTSGAVAYNVWRQGPRTASFSLIGQITDPTVAFADAGAVADDPYLIDPTRLPPTINTTSATSMVTLGPADLALTSINHGPVRAWRIYRSTVSGTYAASSLLAEIATTVNIDGTGGLVPTYIDDGSAALVTGRPQETSQTLHPSIKIGLAGTTPITLSSTSYTWRLTATAGGVATLTNSSGAVSNGSVFLASPTGTWYQLVADDSGTLTTTAATPGIGDTAYLSNDYPLLPTTDATVDYRLAVGDDGSLTLTEIGTPGGGGGGTGSDAIITANPQTSDYTLVLSDAGKVIEMDAVTNTNVYVPTNNDVAFPIGTVIEVDNVNTGHVVLFANGGVTLQSANGLLSLTTQYAGATLRKRDTNTWIAIGSLS